MMHKNAHKMLSGHIREPGHSKFINRPLHNRLRRPLFHLWEHNGQAPSPRLLLWYTAPQEPHTGAYYLWIYHGYFVGWLVHNSSIFADATNASSGDTCRQWLLRLRRLEHKVGLCLLRARPCLTSLFRWRVVAQGAMGGFLLLSVMQAVSRWTNIPLICFVMFHHPIFYKSTVPSYFCVGYHLGTPQPYFSRVLPLQWSCPSSSSSKFHIWVPLQ